MALAARALGRSLWVPVSCGISPDRPLYSQSLGILYFEMNASSDHVECHETPKHMGVLGTRGPLCMHLAQRCAQLGHRESAADPLIRLRDHVRPKQGTLKCPHHLLSFSNPRQRWDLTTVSLYFFVCFYFFESVKA